MSKLIAGTIQITVNGRTYPPSEGGFKYHDGAPVREDIKSDHTVPGFKEVAQAAYISGAFLKIKGLDTASLVRSDEVTVLLILPTKERFSLSEAWYAGTGEHDTSNGQVSAEFHAESGEFL